METDNLTTAIREPWNKGKLAWEDTFQTQRDLAIRVRLQLTSRFRELPLFGLAIDSKFRSCGLVQPRVREVRHGQSWRAERLSFNKRRSCLCSLRSQNRPE